MKVHYSTNSNEWETPPELFDPLDKEFGFTLDVCALPATAKCEEYFTPKDDGLQKAWYGVCWMNPPYGREIAHWMKKALQESQRGVTVVCLVPSRTDTGWWWDYALKGEIRFIRGRVKFLQGGTYQGPAPFPSAIVIFRPNSQEQAQ